MHASLVLRDPLVFAPSANSVGYPICITKLIALFRAHGNQGPFAKVIKKFPLSYEGKEEDSWENILKKEKHHVSSSRMYRAQKMDRELGHKLALGTPCFYFHSGGAYPHPTQYQFIISWSQTLTLIGLLKTKV